jgi:hypothetical protein
MLVGGSTLQADALATRSGGDVGVVDADVDADANPNLLSYLQVSFNV